MFRKLTLTPILILPVIVGVSGCHHAQKAWNMPTGNYQQVARQLPNAAAAPLRDMNIGIKPTPHQLATLQNPYGTDTHINCSIVLREAQDLQAALIANRRYLSGRHYDRNTKVGALGHFADNAIESAAKSIIPFQSALRYLSGAQKRDKLAREADLRGRERLGFLIGVGAANQCPGFYIKATPLR